MTLTYLEGSVIDELGLFDDVESEIHAIFGFGDAAPIKEMIVVDDS